MKSWIMMTALLGALATSALASSNYGTLRTQFLDVSGEQAYISAPGIGEWTIAGVSHMQKLTSPAATGLGLSLPTVFDAVCVDIYGTISYGSVHDWQIVDLTNVPSGGGASPMDAAKASQIAELYDQHFSQLDTNAERAAFSADVWEIVNEHAWTNGSKPWDLDQGNFQISGLSSTAHDLAEQWLGELTGTGGRANVLGLYCEGTQDFGILIADTGVVPEPLTLCSLLLGVSSLGYYVRRRAIPCAVKA